MTRGRWRRPNYSGFAAWKGYLHNGLCEVFPSIRYHYSHLCRCFSLFQEHFGDLEYIYHLKVYRGTFEYMVLYEIFIFGCLLHSYFEYSGVHFVALHTIMCTDRQTDRQIGGLIDGVCKCVSPSTTFIFLINSIRLERLWDVASHHRRFQAPLSFSLFKILGIYTYIYIPISAFVLITLSYSVLSSCCPHLRFWPNILQVFTTFAVFTASFRFLIELGLLLSFCRHYNTTPDFRLKSDKTSSN